MLGIHQSELETPALCIDLDVMQTNLDAMASFMAAHAKLWRPHLKCHKVPQIAELELARGAIGVTAAKSSEADVFARRGIRDILIANMIVGEQKLQRVAAMCEVADPLVACDHFAQAEALSAVCQRRGVRCRVLIEVNIGMNRVGVRPGSDAMDLAHGVASLKGVELAGLMGYEGHLLTEPDPNRKRSQIMSALSILEELRDQMRRRGLACEIVSGGGTGSYQISCQHPVLTEIQAGGGIFGDPFYTERCGVVGLHPAVRVLATVISRPRLERAVLDIGRKSVHPDVFPPAVRRTALGRELPDARVDHLSAEHTTLELGPHSQDLVIGDKVEVIPGYCDHTTVLHERFHGLRDGKVEVIWPIAARGCLQ